MEYTQAVQEGDAEFSRGLDAASLQEGRRTKGNLRLCSSLRFHNEASRTFVL